MTQKLRNKHLQLQESNKTEHSFQSERGCNLRMKNFHEAKTSNSSFIQEKYSVDKSSNGFSTPFSLRGKN